MADLGPGREAVRWGIRPVVRWGVRAVALAGAGLGLWTFSQGTEEEQRRRAERDAVAVDLQTRANTERDQRSTRGDHIERQAEQAAIPPAARPPVPPARTESEQEGTVLIGMNSQIRPFVRRPDATNRFGELIVEVRPNAPIAAEGNRVNITVTTINGVTQTIPGTLGTRDQGRQEVRVVLDAATAPLVRDMREVSAPIIARSGTRPIQSTVDVDDGIREQRIRPNIPAPN